MNSDHRRIIRNAFVSCFVFVLATFLLAGVSWAQDKPPDPQPSPSPPPTNTQKLGTELDGPIIIHSDLVTLTVTVTDTYGRYVSGLNKNAFSIFDEKLPQNISF